MVVWSIAIAIPVAHAHAAGAVGHIDQEDRYVRIGIQLRSDGAPGQVDADCGPRPNRPRSGLVGPYQHAAANPGTNGSETDEHPRSTWSPQWTDLERRLARVSAGQAPFDVARPKGLEPLTF
jgi:hypothetical protein